MNSVANKKRYYELDDIGFVGGQDKRSGFQIRSDMDATAQFIKKRKPRTKSLPKKNKVSK